MANYAEAVVIYFEKYLENQIAEKTPGIEAKNAFVALEKAFDDVKALSPDISSELDGLADLMWAVHDGTILAPETEEKDTSRSDRMIASFVYWYRGEVGAVTATPAPTR